MVFAENAAILFLHGARNWRADQPSTLVVRGYPLQRYRSRGNESTRLLTHVDETVGPFFSLEFQPARSANFRCAQHWNRPDRLCATSLLNRTKTLARVAV